MGNIHHLPHRVRDSYSQRITMVARSQPWNAMVFISTPFEASWVFLYIWKYYLWLLQITCWNGTNLLPRWQVIRCSRRLDLATWGIFEHGFFESSHERPVARFQTGRSSKGCKFTKNDLQKVAKWVREVGGDTVPSPLKARALGHAII